MPMIVTDIAPDGTGIARPKTTADDYFFKEDAKGFNTAVGLINGAAGTVSMTMANGGVKSNYTNGTKTVTGTVNGKPAVVGNIVDGGLPNAQIAFIDSKKLTNYALDSSHPVGGNKAKVFDSALGYNQANANDLMIKIQEGVKVNPAVFGKSDQYGQRFTVDIPVTGPNGNNAVVRTGWIVEPGSTTPKMTTLFVK